MNPTVTVHADASPGAPPVVVHAVIGGPGVQSTTIIEQLRPGQPIQPLTPPDNSSQVSLPPVPAAGLPGCALACQVTLTQLANNAPWAVAFMAYQGNLNLGTAVDHGNLTNPAAISTTWIIFQ
jgi:hypothetical protein